ncbi:hypothetical protein CAAN3_01S08020 [[Candida] anglica]
MSQFSEFRPFSEYSIYDMAVFDAIHYIYNPSNVIFNYISPDTLASSVMVGSCMALATAAAYATISKPINALDPATDVYSPEWDPTDRDSSQSIQLDSEDLKNLNTKYVSPYTTIFHYLQLSSQFTDAIPQFRYISEGLAFSFPVVRASGCAGLLNYMFTAGIRKISYWSGVDFNSFNINKRFKLTYATEIDPEVSAPLGFDKGSINTKDPVKYKLLRERERFYRKRGVQVLKRRDIPSDKQGFVLNLDIVTILSILASYAFTFHLDGKIDSLFITNFAATSYVFYQSIFQTYPTFKQAQLYHFVHLLISTYLNKSPDNVNYYSWTLSIPSAPRNLQLTSHDSFQKLFSGLDTIPWIMSVPILDISSTALFLGLCLRFDLYNHHSKSKRAFHHLSSFSKPYFWAAFIGSSLRFSGYIFDIEALGSKNVSYLVPLPIIFVLITSLVRGEYGLLREYNEKVENFDAAGEEGEEEEEQQQEDQLQDKFSLQELLAKDFGEEEEEEDPTYDYELEVEPERDELEYDENYHDDDEAAPIDYETDLDVVIQKPVYVFDTDSDDDTFRIESESESDSDVDVIPQNEIDILRIDNRFEPRIIYSDDSEI